MNLTRITSEKLTLRAVRELRKAFARRGRKVTRTVGYQSGSVPNCQLYVVDNAGIWMTVDVDRQRNWCAFGVTPLPATGSVKITVEINSPLSGIDRRLGGLLATDGPSRIFFCHTGRVGGGRRGIGKSRFVAWYDEEPIWVVDPDQRRTKAFLVAEIGSPRFVEHIAEFVHAVRRFKDEKPTGVKGAKKPSVFSGADSESENKRSVPGHAGFDAGCDHAIVRNRLAELIRGTGLRARRDKYRDLLVIHNGKPLIEFEVKSAASTQCIYAAVGQLLVHNVEKPVRRRVAVLPSPVRPTVERALSSLKIDLVTYKMADGRVHFNRLKQIIPGVAETAPLTQRE